MRRTTIFLALISTVTMALILAACTSTSDDDADVGDDATPAVTEVPAETETPDETPDADEDPDATPDEGADDSDPIRDLEELEQDVPIAPEPFFLSSSAGQQEGWARNYFWSDPGENVAMEIEGYYVPLPEEPLAVEAGEALTFEWERDDIDPEEITVTVYPREENFEESVSTRDGESDAFLPNTEEVLTEDIDAADATWTVDLDEGEYFLLVNTLWPTPEEWPKDRQAEFGFWIEVR